MASLPSQIALRTYRWEGVIFNVFCGVYFLFFASGVTDAAGIAMRDPEGTAPWLGILLAVIVMAETWAFPVKMRFVNEAIRDQGDSGGKAFYLWIFHTLISVILLFMIAGSFGVKITGEDEMPRWLAVLIFVTVVKELILLGFLWITPEADAEPSPKHKRPSAKEWTADAILVVYACVAYSATWSTITDGMELADKHPAMVVTNFFIAILLFLMFYLPLRIPYWVEEMAQVKSAADGWRLVGSILLVMLPVLLTF